MHQVRRAVTRAGQGLQGDRYFDQRGTFSNVYGRGHDLTLVEAEVLEGLAVAGGPLASEDAGRNVVTRGIDLNALVGRHFRSAKLNASASGFVSRAHTLSA
jgi:hypothetical protein